MSTNKKLVAVTAVGCISRFRNGIQFSKSPKQVEVTTSELDRLEADSYLQVKVISQEAYDEIKQGDMGDNASNDLQTSNGNTNPANRQSNTSNGDDDDKLENNQDSDKNAGDEQNTDDENQSAGNQGADESKTSAHDDVVVIVEAMKSLSISPSGDKPTVAALKKHGIEVTAQLRDEAWDILVAEQG